MDASQQRLVALGIMGAGMAYVYWANHSALLENGKAKGPGEFSFANSYQNVSSFKHDLFKQTTLNLVPFAILTILLGTQSGEFFSTEDFFGSVVGRTVLDFCSYFIFYQIVQPQLANRIPNF